MNELSERASVDMHKGTERALDSDDDMANDLPCIIDERAYTGLGIHRDRRAWMTGFAGVWIQVRKKAANLYIRGMERERHLDTNRTMNISMI